MEKVYTRIWEKVRITFSDMAAELKNVAELVILEMGGLSLDRSRQPFRKQRWVIRNLLGGICEKERDEMGSSRWRPMITNPANG